MERNQFDWVDFYKEFADILIDYKDDRGSLINKIKKTYDTIDMNLPTLEKKGYEIVDIDPFTIFGLFNKGITEENRIKIVTEIANEFNVKSKIPSSFDSIPILNNINATFYHFIGERERNDIDNLWNFFEASLNYSKEQSEENKMLMSKYFDITIDIKGIGNSKLTMGIFWIAPEIFLNLDSRNIWYIYESGKLPESIVETLPVIKGKLNADIYFEILEKVRIYVYDTESIFKDFKELSFSAWVYSNKVNDQIRANKLEDDNTETSSDVYTPKIKNKQYTVTEFLNEVYISQDRYKLLTDALKYKKNIILQGAPGVGKTFIAKRLAYSLMGEKDNNRIKFVQFHQSYSYEDFVMGFRPIENGFELKTGPFYDFCKKAENDKEKDYYFIIDEINRGNLSKIFGELFMLIEKEYRGNYSELIYSDKKFSVPDNIYIIGMMNTADRSLAMLDYALRRRFAFFELKPGFQSEGFKKYKDSINSSKFHKLISCIEELNKEIVNDESLGDGFQIGHSYFCEIDSSTSYNLIVEYELIPLIKEYWFDDYNRVLVWSEKLRDSIK